MRYFLSHAHARQRSHIVHNFHIALHKHENVLEHVRWGCLSSVCWAICSNLQKYKLTGNPAKFKRHDVTWRVKYRRTTNEKEKKSHTVSNHRHSPIISTYHVRTKCLAASGKRRIVWSQKRRAWTWTVTPAQRSNPSWVCLKRCKTQRRSNFYSVFLTNSGPGDTPNIWRTFAHSCDRKQRYIRIFVHPVYVVLRIHGIFERVLPWTGRTDYQKMYISQENKALSTTLA